MRTRVLMGSDAALFRSTGLHVTRPGGVRGGSRPGPGPGPRPRRPAFDPLTGKSLTD